MLLDELPEFGHTNLEPLRQLIEDEVVTIYRTQGTVLYSVNFMLVGAHESIPVRIFRRSIAGMLMLSYSGESVQ